MTIEVEIRKAIVGELERQAVNSDGKLKVDATEDRVMINGAVDLDDLVMVVLGSIAGGP